MILTRAASPAPAAQHNGNFVPGSFGVSKIQPVLPSTPLQHVCDAVPDGSE